MEAVAVAAALVCHLCSRSPAQMEMDGEIATTCSAC